LNDDGSPSAGAFDGWPRTAKEIRVLDPCMGSGHFLVFALPIVARMRMEEESLTLHDALISVLRDNLFGLELDARCAQIAAFNLALAAWRMTGRHFSLPELRLACSGLGINASEEDWRALAGKDERRQQLMQHLYQFFRNGPVLASLLDPRRTGMGLIDAEMAHMLPAIEQALTTEPDSEEGKELAISAQGTLTPFRILTAEFTLVATNVPYLGRGKQDSVLAEYSAEFHADAKTDLSTCFVDRCLRFCMSGGSAALVTPQNWLFLTTFAKMRERLLKQSECTAVIKLGPAAFQDMNWWAANASLLVLTNQMPQPQHAMIGIDVSGPRDPAVKAQQLFSGPVNSISQDSQLRHPDCRILLSVLSQKPLLEQYASCYQGVSPADFAKYGRCFWEIGLGITSRIWS
jgi:N-6 DNA Methylase